MYDIQKWSIITRFRSEGNGAFLESDEAFDKS